MKFSAEYWPTNPKPWVIVIEENGECEGWLEFASEGEWAARMEQLRKYPKRQKFEEFETE